MGNVTMCKLCIARITRMMLDNEIQVISVLRMDKAEILTEGININC